MITMRFSYFIEYTTEVLLIEYKDIVNFLLILSLTANTGWLWDGVSCGKSDFRKLLCFYFYCLHSRQNECRAGEWQAGRADNVRDPDLTDLKWAHNLMYHSGESS